MRRNISMQFDICSSALTNLLHNVHAFENLAEDDVTVVEPAGDHGGDELKIQLFREAPSAK